MTIAVALAYLLAAVLFIFGLIELSSPKTARRGNQIAAVGMVIALLATIPLLHFTTAGIAITIIGILIGVPIGAIGALELYRCMPIASVIASRCTCGRPAARFDRAPSISSARELWPMSEYQRAVSRRTTSTVCKLRAPCSASALARLLNSRSVAATVWS